MCSTLVPAVSYDHRSSGSRKGRSSEVKTRGAGTAAMDSGPACTAEEDLALALSARDVQEDRIVGTDETWDEMIAATFRALKVRKDIKHIPEDQHRRTEAAVACRLRLTLKDEQIKKNIFRRSEKEQLMGSPTDEGMMSAAVAELCAVSVYDFINGDRAEEVRRSEGKNRNAKQVQFPFLEYWRVLRYVYKISGAAAVCAALAASGSSSESAEGVQRKRAYNDCEEDEEEPLRGKRGK